MTFLSKEHEPLRRYLYGVGVVILALLVTLGVVTDEIAYGVGFLADEQASWITGSNRDINGGHHMGW